MDKFHIILIVLLGISIIFLGISAIPINSVVETSKPTDSVVETSNGKEQEIWSIKITPDHLNNIADKEWLARLKINSTSYVSGSDLLCLNICGNRCLWLGYTYKSHSVESGSYFWGDKENAICSCDCYVIKNRIN